MESATRTCRPWRSHSFRALLVYFLALSASRSRRLPTLASDKMPAWHEKQLAGNLSELSGSDFTTVPDLSTPAPDDARIGPVVSDHTMVGPRRICIAPRCVCIGPRHISIGPRYILHRSPTHQHLPHWRLACMFFRILTCCSSSSVKAARPSGAFASSRWPLSLWASIFRHSVWNPGSTCQRRQEAKSGHECGQHP